MTLTVGPKLKELRFRKGESLQDVADAVQASKAHIWELETGKSQNPSLGLIRRLAEHFKVTVANLVGEEPNELDEFIVMFRDLQGLGEEDREIIQDFIDVVKKRRRMRASDGN